MRVLYLDHPEADYLSAVVFRGLCEELGPENVVDWPWMPHFHGQVYEGPVPYGDGAVGVCGPYSWMPKNEQPAWTDEQVLGQLTSFDLVVLASPRTYNTQRMRTIVGKFPSERLIMLDGEDYTTPRWDLIQEFNPRVYFKTSLVPNPPDPYPSQHLTMQDKVRVVPCPLATSLFEPPTVEKKYDVCFLGGSNWFGERREGHHEDRIPVKPAIERMLMELLPGKQMVLGHVPYEQYLDIVAASRVAICVSGHGLEGMRTFEAMSCPDTLVVREVLPQITPWPLVGGDTCVTFRRWENIAQICKTWLENETMRLEIAKRGFDLVWQHYTPRARARYILDEAFK